MRPLKSAFNLTILTRQWAQDNGVCIHSRIFIKSLRCLQSIFAILQIFLHLSRSWTDQRIIMTDFCITHIFSIFKNKRVKLVIHLRNLRTTNRCSHYNLYNLFVKLSSLDIRFDKFKLNIFEKIKETFD